MGLNTDPRKSSFDGLMKHLESRDHTKRIESIHRSKFSLLLAKDNMSEKSEDMNKSVSKASIKKIQRFMKLSHAGRSVISKSFSVSSSKSNSNDLFV